MTDHSFSIGVFLNFCLLKEDKRRLHKFQRILKEFRESLKEFNKFLNSLEKKNFDGKDIRKKSIKASRLEDSINYNSLGISSPHELKHGLLIEVISEVVEGEDPSYGDLKQINNIITKHLYDITEELGERKKLLEKEMSEFDNQKIVNNIEEMEKEILNYRRSLVEIIEEGRVDS
jgi:hypothetical protein